MKIPRKKVYLCRIVRGLLPGYARIFRPDLTDVLQRELLLRGLGQFCVLVTLVVCLLAYTKQPAKDAHGIALRVPRVQVCHRLAPAFFLISTLNFFSATLIISSYKSARISACFSLAFIADSSAFRA